MYIKKYKYKEALTVKKLGNVGYTKWGSGSVQIAFLAFSYIVTFVFAHIAQFHIPYKSLGTRPPTRGKK